MQYPHTPLSVFPYVCFIWTSCKRHDSTHDAHASVSSSEIRTLRSGFVLLCADAQHCARATVRMWLAEITLRAPHGAATCLMH